MLSTTLPQRLLQHPSSDSVPLSLSLALSLPPPPTPPPGLLPSPLLAHPAPRQGQSALAIFVRKLSRSEDEYVRHLSARVAARLLLHGADPEDDTLKAYYKWLLTEVESGDRTRMLPALSCLAQVFRRTPFRLAFCRLPNAVDLLRVQVGVDAPIQQLYQAILCLWILSFSGEAVELMGESAFAAVASVADVLASAKKEKVVRVCVAFLRNMAEVENKEKSLEATTLMVSHRLLTVVQGLATQGTFSYVQGSGGLERPRKGTWKRRALQLK